MARFTGETGTILKIIKEPDAGSRAMVLTDMSAKELEVCMYMIFVVGYDTWEFRKCLFCVLY